METEEKLNVTKDSLKIFYKTKNNENCGFIMFETIYFITNRDDVFQKHDERFSN